MLPSKTNNFVKSKNLLQSWIKIYLKFGILQIYKVRTKKHRKIIFY